MATKTQTLTIRLGPKLRGDLERAAEETEMSLGELVRFVLFMWTQSLDRNSARQPNE